MAFIEIYVTPNKQAACANYFFRDGRPEEICSIKPGEVAYVPDDELDKHIDTQFVHQTTLAKSEGRIVNEVDRPRPGRKPNVESGE